MKIFSSRLNLTKACQHFEMFFSQFSATLWIDLNKYTNLNKRCCRETRRWAWKTMPKRQYLNEFPKNGIEWMKMMQVRDTWDALRSWNQFGRVSIKFIYSLPLHITQKTRSDFGFWLHFRYRFPRFSFILKAQEKLTLQFCRIELNISYFYSSTNFLWEIAELDDNLI